MRRYTRRKGGVVERDLLRDRLDRRLGVAQLPERRGDVRKDAGAYPAQDGRTEAGGLLHAHHGDGAVEDRRLDPHQQPVLDAAADGVDGPQIVQARVPE
jgi:hypothetical protein